MDPKSVDREAPRSQGETSVSDIRDRPNLSHGFFAKEGSKIKSAAGVSQLENFFIRPEGRDKIKSEPQNIRWLWSLQP